MVILALAALGRLLEATVKIIPLGWLNKLLGVVFAILKYAIILGLLLMLFDDINRIMNLVKPDVFAQSVLYRPFLDMADSIFPYLKGLF